MALLFGELVEGGDLVGPLVGEPLHLELQFVILGKLALRHHVVFLAVELLFRILHRFPLQLAALLRLYSEVGVGLRADLGDDRGALFVVLGKLPHRVLPHVPVFERFDLRAHTS